MPGDDSQSSPNEGITKAPPDIVGLEQLTPRSSHIPIDSALLTVIKRSMTFIELNKGTFTKELAKQLEQTTPRLRSRELKNAIDYAKQAWDVDDSNVAIRNTYRVLMMSCGFFMPWFSPDVVDYEPIRKALTYLPTLDNVIKYNSLKYNGTRVPSVFTDIAPPNTKHICPTIIIEENGKLNRLMSLCGKDMLLQGLCLTFVANKDRRANILFYICENYDKPSLLTSLTYLEPLHDVETLIANYEVEI